MRRTLLLPLVLLAFVAVACVNFQRWQKSQTQMLREIELQDVAKSWCQTIRASQVIPVYPLTEDLMPGDVFLVERTIDDQHEEYTRRGFLPLDYHVARLEPDGYQKFYENSVLPVMGAAQPWPIPRGWMRPDGGLPERDGSWNEAPRAAFPSYSFSVKAGGGFNLAVPVSGVPVGMSLMAAQSASGTVSFKDAKTIGVDIMSAYKDLKKWCEDPGHRRALLPYVSTPEKPSYLRVVTRVYLIGSIDVSLNASQSGGAGLDLGVPKPVPGSEAPETAEGEAAKTAGELYAKNLESINAALKEGIGEAGGSLRVTSASANTVSLRETFHPPLVVGYLGFDCEILPGADVGDPCPTRLTLEDPTLAARLVAADRLSAVEIDNLGLAAVDLIREVVKPREEGDGRPELPASLKDSGEAIVSACDDLWRYARPGTPVYKKSLAGVSRSLYRRPNPDEENPGYKIFREFKGGLRTSLKAIDDQLAAGSGDAGQLKSDRAIVAGLHEARPWAVDEEVALRSALQWVSRFGITSVD